MQKKLALQEDCKTVWCEKCIKKDVTDKEKHNKLTKKHEQEAIKN